MGMLSDVSDTGLDSARSLIISMSELIAREGAELTRGMHFRDGDAFGRLSVLLVLPREGEYTDRFDPNTQCFAYQGHDSVAEGAQGRLDDQLLMYAGGKPTENGKFYKAAQAYKDGLRAEPLQVQIYEKLDAGVFFDKGISNLVDATFAIDPTTGTRKVVTFYLVPADAAMRDPSWDERMIDPTDKAAAWKHSGGRCEVCESEVGLHFVTDNASAIRLVCALHIVSRPGNAII